MTPHSEDAVQVTQHFANYFVRFVVLSFYFYIQLGTALSSNL